MFVSASLFIRWLHFPNHLRSWPNVDPQIPSKFQKPMDCSIHFVARARSLDSRRHATTQQRRLIKINMNTFHFPLSTFHLPPSFVSLSLSHKFPEHSSLFFFLSFFLPPFSYLFIPKYHKIAAGRDFSPSDTLVSTHSFLLFKHSHLLTLIFLHSFSRRLLKYFHHASLQLFHLLPFRGFRHTSLILPPPSFKPSAHQQPKANFDSRQHMWRRKWLHLQPKRLIRRKLLLRCWMVRCVVSSIDCRQHVG